jgi:hydrogenase maturation protein HypF
VQAPRTSSVGRLFDVVAALLGLRSVASFEGQAAMELEFAAAADATGAAAPYPLPLGGGEPAVADWEPLVRHVLADRERGVPAPRIAARFHAALAELAVAIARRAALPRVVLSGGCFQNRLLQEALRRRLREAGFQVYTHHRVPANDGGLALGQAVVAGARHAAHPGGDRHVPGHPRQGALHR